MPDINVNKISEALNTKADIDLNNTGVFSTSSGGVNLVQSTPSDAKGKEVTSADFSLKQGGLELMDVVFAPLGIDESKNKRRYLNGQVIIQEQFPAFTAAVKARMATMANAFTTEENWQAEKTNSKLGQCGKFVVDDTAGTIRLPCVVNAQGLADLALIGGIKSESLPNITGDYNSVVGYTNASKTKAFQDSTVASSSFGASGSGVGRFNLKFSASKSSSTYQDNAPVQQEAIQYPYCIVVNVGVEETDRPINNYQVNNVYSYGMSQYYKGTMNNNSWLKSAGQWNDGTVYTGMYNWLLEQMNNGVSGFLNSVMYAYSPSGSGIIFTLPTLTPKVGMTCYGWTDGSYENMPLSVITSVAGDGSFQAEYQGTNYVFVRNPGKDQATVYPTDYDFVINTADKTFRLPLLNGDENWVGNETSVLSTADIVKDSPFQWTATKNGFVKFTCYKANTTQVVIARINGKTLIHSGVATTTTTPRPGFWLKVRKGDTISISAESQTLSAVSITFIPAVGNGSLYYYIGDTLQNAQLINVARIEETLVTKTNKVQAAEASMPSGRYIDLTLGSSGTTYTAPANGWFSLRWWSTASATSYFNLYNTTAGIGMLVVPNQGYAYEQRFFVPAKKGDVISFIYGNIESDSGTHAKHFRFIYAEGDQ